MKVRDIMTANPFAVTPDDTVRHAAALMREIRVGCVPVVKDQLHRKVVGLITDRDIAIRCVAEGCDPAEPVRDYMTGSPIFAVRPDDSVSSVVRLMENKQVRRIPVVSEHFELLGIVAQADVATKLGPIQPLTVEEVLERVSRRPLVVS